jgi:DNA polymerase-3 subunit epsilon
MQPYFCTVQLARQNWNIRPTKLPDVCRHLNLSLNHHDALSDAEACANIVLAAIRDGGM